MQLPSGRKKECYSTADKKHTRIIWKKTLQNEWKLFKHKTLLYLKKKKET